MGRPSEASVQVACAACGKGARPVAERFRECSRFLPGAVRRTRCTADCLLPLSRLPHHGCAGAYRLRVIALFAVSNGSMCR
jgi:hypothetical protein